MTKEAWALRRAVLIYASVIGLALALLAMSATQGGLWAMVALLYITLGIAALDLLTTHDLGAQGAPWAGYALSTVLGGIHFAVLYGSLAVLVAGDQGLAAKLALFAAAGLYLGQVSNANAHELIHAKSRARRWLGAWAYISVGFGHHVSAHLGVHHVHVATPRDPNSAPRGRSFWRFLPRCWVGSFRAGLALERGRLARRGRGPWHPRNPYWIYVLGFLGNALGALALGGGLGLWLYLSLCGFVQTQLILSDYVQHYGLRRAKRPNGTYAPQGPEHSWDAPHWASGALMLNAPRHADHHLHPGRAFPLLDLPQDTPHHPYPLPVMAVIALFPPLWRRVVHPHLDKICH